MPATRLANDNLLRQLVEVRREIYDALLERERRWMKMTPYQKPQVEMDRGHLELLEAKAKYLEAQLTLEAQ
jgi:hypothetical protein